MFCLKLNKWVSNFHPLEVVGRGSETQLQVANINCNATLCDPFNLGDTVSHGNGCIDSQFPTRLHLDESLTQSQMIGKYKT